MLIKIIGLIAAFCTTISFLPQAIHTIRTRNTSGISLLMYTIFTFGVGLWLIYGILLEDLAIILANTITICFSAVILACKIKYK